MVGIEAARAVEVKQEIEIKWACDTQAIVEAQIDSIIATGAVEDANDMLRKSVGKGECAISAEGPVAATVTALGKVWEPIEVNGLVLVLRAVQVDGTFWTGHVDVVKAMPKT